jgi:hypothetical protein
MEVVHSSETSVNIYWTTQHQITVTEPFIGTAVRTSNPTRIALNMKNFPVK